MRTTITLDEDVAAKLRTAARKSGRSFKDVVNDALRAGLAVGQRATNLPPFRIDMRERLRLTSGFDYDKVEDVLDRLDGPRRLR